jgi:hypothetical protein
MTTTLNATTSNGLVVTPDNSGNIVLQYNGVAAPAFSAYCNTAQSIPNSAWTKMQVNVKEFDTASCYDNSTNYRFTPNVAGYYQVSAQSHTNNGVNGRYLCSIYKNGSIFKLGNDTASNNTLGITLSTLVYLNGSTDYIEFYVYQGSGTSQALDNSSTSNFFQACLLRGA